MSDSKFTCRHCGAIYSPFRLPPHNCAGVQLDMADLAKATPEVQPRADARPSRPLLPGDTVEWTERVFSYVNRVGAIRPERRRGVVSRIVQGEALIRVGNTLVQLNLGRLKRVATKMEGARG